MNQSLENEIVCRRQGGQSVRGIARDLNVSRWLVSRVVHKHTAARDGTTDSPPATLGPSPARRPSQLDWFEPQIRRLLERYPRITAMRILEELRLLDYRGGYTILRERVRELRRKPLTPLTTRFETGPGVQA